MTGAVLETPIEVILKERLRVDRSEVATLCEQFEIAQLSLFGSVLRDDFRAEGEVPSDVDVLIVYKPGHRMTWAGWLALEDALKELFGRKVDVVRKKLITNPYVRAEILKTHRLVYEQH